VHAGVLFQGAGEYEGIWIWSRVNAQRHDAVPRVWEKGVPE